MIPAELVPWVPPVALGLLLVAVVVTVGSLVRRGLSRRPALGVALALAIAPALYVAAVWTRLVPESYLRFERPFLGALAFPAMAFVAARLLAHRSRGGRARRVLSDGLVALAVLTSAIAAAGPELGRPLDRMTVVVVVDRSRSIDLVPAADTRIDRELAAAQTGMRDDDRIGTVVFATEAAVEEPLRGPTDLPSPQRVDLGRDGTDLAAGIARALAEIPADTAGRVVVLSDGVSTSGDVLSAAAAAVAGEVPIDVIPLEQRKVADVRVVAVEMTPRANEGETLGMRVVIASPEETDVEIRLKRDGEVVRKIPARVAAGEDVLRIREPTPGSGLHRYDVEVTAKDPRLDESAEDNRGTAFVRVRGPARALVLDGDGGTRFIASALEQAGFRVEEGTTSSFPGDIGAMAAYDLVIFGDIPAKDLAPHQLDALASFVRDLGGGLLLTGGDRSFGPGGYSQTPVEAISPVSFDLKQERRRASLAEVIAIDISGSMAATVGSQTKLELANEAAARSAKLLGQGDMLGVVHVDTTARWAVPLALVTDEAAIEKAIRSVGPGGGGILVDVALDQAYAELRKVQVNLKHVLLFADGSDAENITPAVQGWVSSAMTAGITTSCVSLGRGHHSPLLEDLSRRGGGRFYIVEDASRLPAVFAQETVLASRSAIVEREFRARIGNGHDATRGVDFGAAPALSGYVVTIPKPRATVPLVGPDDDPLLALWPAGLGRTAAFTSDLKDRWGGRWTQWEGAATTLVQVARSIARRQDDARVRLETDTSGGQLHVRATVVDDDGRLASFRRLSVTVRGPGGFEKDVTLDAAGAGTYAATVPLQSPGAYVAVAKDDVTGLPVATAGAALSAGEEMRPTGSDVALLDQIAELTGGVRRDTLAGIFADRAALRFAYHDITQPLLLVAAFALLLMVAARRLSLPDLSRFRPRPAPVLDHESSEPETGTLDHLLAKRQDEAPPPAAAEPPSPPAEPPPPPAEPPPPPAEPPGDPSLAERLAAQRRAPAKAEPPKPPPPPAADVPSNWGKRPDGKAAPSPPPRAASPANETDDANLSAAELLARRRRRKKR